MPRAFLLTWNPKKWRWPRHKYEKEVAVTGEGDSYPLNWSCGNTKKINSGDRLYMVRLNNQRGIIGSGRAERKPDYGPHWDESRTDEILYVEGRSDALLPEGKQLPMEMLKKADLGIAWDNLLKSGNQVPDESAARLEEMWQSHLRRVMANPPVAPLAEEPGGKYFDGALKRIEVNAYERDPRARRACLAHNGFNCAACDQSLADIYGEVGEGVIHVHHVKELSKLGRAYEINPKRDLVPVCPNCHAILHTEKPALSIRKLRSILSKQRKA